MRHSYPETYLNNAIQNMGEMFDYAQETFDIEPDVFMSMFITSGLSTSFEKGNPRIVSGMTGVELACEVIRLSGSEHKCEPALTSYDRSITYWCGWVLAYYQWYSGRTFREITNVLPMSELSKLYGTLHEASEQKMLDVLEKRSKRKRSTTNLQSIRKNRGLTQKGLATYAQVNLRTLQQYETRAKDINLAAFTTVEALANALGCKSEDLKEYE